ncbi:hypothetical protein [Rhizobium sp. RAF56]|uniref:hypothetical protein n=1 Tax=Rhizobium sp. RAF56 TaxID=3233062 RepID=UPI003F9EABC8
MMLVGLISLGDGGFEGARRSLPLSGNHPASIRQPSAAGQDHAGQVEWLKAAGATKIFQEKRSGVDREREELKSYLALCT